MSTTIAENANRDLYLGTDGNIAFLTDVTGNPIATAQLTKGRMESQQGEMIYATADGMPTRETAWDNYNTKQFEAAARSIIVNTPEVTGVASFTMNTDTENTLTYDAQINTTYGTTTVSTQ